MEKYNIPMGTLVEIQDSGLETDKKSHGVRLYVVGHHKDPIGKHLYSLGLKGETNGLKMYNGYYEEGLKVIDKISVELTNDEINDIFVRFVVDVLFVLIGRFSFVCRRCLAKRSLLVKKSV